ncbi:transporter substrate-binding domain-containing protein [Aestuariirhabdus sp. Z084]|uniref:substrate-binding periplasmic protein n=1 Tax=Aestuariirhabdus haliotis TaxID=2918751 RepID=UPI00201B42C1|nr:transporter substrate-binding domain-containing protein [Aestuariirhabdus haliotis]MCL6416420.1 transporter substrate-binding domain-containing protein [Aestuariirhabdus haliotis]MCL6420414.1 transporter substrate-binding domain-containing protein [Aestuariirhabdus haliotis]
MIAQRYNIALLMLLLLPLNCAAGGNTVKIGVAEFPPYSIVESNRFSGVEVEIVQQSLEVMGYRVELVNYPYGRLPFSFRSKRVDAIIVTLKNFKDIPVFYSDIVLPEYQTVAVYLKENNFQIKSISDLQSHSILAHQRANLFYGDEYKRIAEQNGHNKQYQETANQLAQVAMLFKKRVDIIVLAHEIFIYYKSRIDLSDSDSNYVVAKIFGNKFGFHNAVWDKKVRDDFNAGLAIIKTNGLYDKILTKYLVTYKLNIRKSESVPN